MNDWACPVPNGSTEKIQMAHGGGGSMMAELLGRILPQMGVHSEARLLHDSAVLRPGGGRLAFTTDSYVVKPLIFPGGDIGKLAVHGTVNDLAMSGARPEYLSCGLIIEEGLETSLLESIVRSMADAARRSGVRIVTGDTKVVEHGKCDGLYINTSGIGTVVCDYDIGAESIRENDAVIVSGDLGRHSVAVMAARDGFELPRGLGSDTAPLHEPVLDLLGNGIPVHCLRDLTRGGLASALCELATDSSFDIQIQGAEIKVDEGVRGISEILGLEPLHLANEGRFVAFVPQQYAARSVEILAQHPVSFSAAVVGRVLATRRSRVTLKSEYGTEQLVLRPSGELLPRIC